MASDVPLAPDFLQFLFSNKPKFDCYFEVGNKSQGKPERIGAVKLMLMAHSEVFRLELEDSDLKEKGDVPVKDVHPDTFKGMLKYVYGHDTTSDLCFDEADNLLYVAEKYMIKTLKDKLAVRLMKLLNPDNICSLLNNPVCYTHLELDKAITEILRYETDRVLASPQFLWMNADGFLKILEQDGLAVPEIELWRAAIKWAKHRADSEDGQQLRQPLSGLTRHLRLCTLTADEIVEVIPSGVLSSEEICAVCLSIGKNEKPLSLTEISNEIVPRKILNFKMKPNNHETYKLQVTGLANCSVVSNYDYNFTLLTKQHAIELLPLVCPSRDQVSIPENCAYKVAISKVANSDNPGSSSTSEPQLTVSFNENVNCEVEFEIPLAVSGRNITLLPNSEYTVRIEMNGSHKRYGRIINRNSCGWVRNDHLSLNMMPLSRETQLRGRNIIRRYLYFPSPKLQYKITNVL